MHSAAITGAGEYVCELCSVKVSGARNMSQHLSSARHLRRAATAARGIAAAAVSAHDGGTSAHPGAAGQAPLQGGLTAAGGLVQPIGDYCQQVGQLSTCISCDRWSDRSRNNTSCQHLLLRQASAFNTLTRCGKQSVDSDPPRHMFSNSMKSV